MKYYFATFDIFDLSEDIDKTFARRFWNVFQSLKTKWSFIS